MWKACVHLPVQALRLTTKHKRAGADMTRQPGIFSKGFVVTQDSLSFLSTLHPYDALPDAVRLDIAEQLEVLRFDKGDQIYDFGEPLKGLYVIREGEVTVRDEFGHPISHLERGNSFGERGLVRDGRAVTSAVADSPTALFQLPVALFHKLRVDQAAFRRFFDRDGSDQAAPTDLTRVRVESLMFPDPVICAPDDTVMHAARLMRDRRISCLCVCEGDALVGLVTVRDLSNKALADGLPGDTPVADVMTRAPKSLAPSAIGSDVLHLMMEHRLGHLPVVTAGKLVGIVTQTDLTKFQAASTAGLVSDAARAASPSELSEITSRIPNLLVQLVAAGNRHDVVTRMITDIADVVTRRLLGLAEDRFGPPPCRYLWLACGSQGRQEQTGVSDQDNCLILEEGATKEQIAWFKPFAQFVSDGLNDCGYVYCPGDMMATNPRWCQPISVWRSYFEGWIRKPVKEAQMLASVMFDLRPIGGDESLYSGLQADILKKASSNSIFTAHMASNALTHQTPLGLLRGFATIRSGEHRNTIDMKHNGVVPVVDLGRMYALQAQLRVVNTRARLEAGLIAGAVSKSGGEALLNAYDLVAQTRLEHQARQIKHGEKPDNFLPPSDLSDFERSHLRDAFVVIKTMQSALMQGRGVLG